VIVTSRASRQPAFSGISIISSILGREGHENKKDTKRLSFGMSSSWFSWLRGIRVQEMQLTARVLLKAVGR
jgi:hypothetical protein